MAVDDRWYLAKRSLDGERITSQRYGRGKRWRYRYEDANATQCERLFDRKADADAWEARARAGVAAEARVDHARPRITFREYGERWRLSRDSGWAVRPATPGQIPLEKKVSASVANGRKGILPLGRAELHSVLLDAVYNHAWSGGY